MKTIKKLLPFILLINFTSVLFGQVNKSECANFKTGKFHYLEDPSDKITRTEKFQIEENPVVGFYAKLKITWISECDYDLQPVKLKGPGSKLIPKDVVMHVKIIKTEQDRYVYSAEYMGITTSKTIIKDE